MLKIKVLILFFLINTSFSQTIYESFESEFLNDSRELKIQLPRNYDDNNKKKNILTLTMSLERFLIKWYPGIHMSSEKKR